MTPALLYLVSGLHWPTDGLAGRPGYEPIDETTVPNGVRLGLVLDEAEIWQLLGSGWMHPREVMETAVRLLPLAIDSPMHEAVHYFSESIRGVWVSPGDYWEVLVDGRSPLSTTDRVQVEQALQNAFKCVEALTGEPPSAEQKRRALLRALNVSPDEQVGFRIAGGPSYLTTALEKLSEFQSARDKRAAHAGIPNQRAARYAELLDFQQFARFVCLRALGVEELTDCLPLTQI